LLDTSLLENARIITRLENAQVRARLENSNTIARLIRERSKSEPFIIPRTGPKSLTPPPAGLTTVEQAQVVKALRLAGELAGSEELSAVRSEFPAVPEAQNGLRGMEETQSFYYLQAKGSVIDRLI